MGIHPSPALARRGIPERDGRRWILCMALAWQVFLPAAARELSEAEAIAAALSRDDFVAHSIRDRPG